MISYFSVVSNQGSYRAIKHEFKLIFLFHIMVTTILNDIIPKCYFSIYPFEEILQMRKDHDYLVEERNYDKDDKTFKIVVVECALFGEYVDQLNDFFLLVMWSNRLLIMQLAKIKLFREVIDFRKRMRLLLFLVLSLMLLKRVVSGIPLVFVERQFNQNMGSTFVMFSCIMSQMLKVAVSDHIGQGMFVLFDHEIAYLLNKPYIDLFHEVQKDSSVLCGDNYPIIFKTLEGKKVLLKVDTKYLGIDKYFRTFRVKRICDDPAIISMFELFDNEVTTIKVVH
ncbi:hypothetical protein Ahy_B02g059123 [Arachis hypogaea]|uniref:DUF223 domain-containing protein n=1 Tax=Arachis hypogaea TaxID=3818 RepID=A0A445AG43_ARAHY|nr:hypothetical protein Ahy_B02g059123 [Arachis hypogaea]